MIWKATSSDFQYLSSSPGASDKIGFNDPVPGMWYILLNTDEVFGDIKKNHFSKEQIIDFYKDLEVDANKPNPWEV